MDFTNLEELEKYLNQVIQQSLETEVYKTVQDTMDKHIQVDVYDMYEPKVYRRRYASKYEGLKNRGNLEIVDPHNTIIDQPYFSVNDGFVLNLFKNVTDSDNRDKWLVPIIETGKGYTWFNSFLGEGEMIPRPFIRNTKRSLKRGRLHINAMKRGLLQYVGRIT